MFLGKLGKEIELYDHDLLNLDLDLFSSMAITLVHISET